MRFKAYAATMQGVWFSEDGGNRWARLLTPTGGMYNEARVWAVATHPDRPGELLAGTDQGLYRFTGQAGRFDHIPSPMDALQILQIARDPRDAAHILCGTRPGEIFRSTDDGATWERTRLHAATECWFINTSRVTSIHFDPWRAETVWATVEIDGILRSDDRGRTWRLAIEGLQDNDCHDLVFHEGPDGARAILVSTEEGVHRSVDDGASWVQEPTDAAPFVYFRSLKARADHEGTLIASVGDKPSGETGMLLISRDVGASWQAARIEGWVNSTIWSIATHPADPMLLFAATIFGQIWRSDDGGESWQKMPRELGEIRMIAWAPVP